MNINGYKIQHTLRELQHEREIIVSQFGSSLFSFEGETKAKPIELSNKYKACEKKIARLQTLQAEYNLKIQVVVQGEEMSLSEAIKRVGGAGRIEKLWRSSAKDAGLDRFERRERSRNKDEIYSQRTASVDECISQAKTAAKEASALREAIQVGNAQEWELELDPDLF
jgi:hypothetical protein